MAILINSPVDQPRTDRDELWIFSQVLGGILKILLALAEFLNTFSLITLRPFAVVPTVNTPGVKGSFISDFPFPKCKIVVRAYWRVCMFAVTNVSSTLHFVRITMVN